MSDTSSDVLARLAALEDAHERSKVHHQRQLEERDMEIEALSMRLREFNADVPYTAIDTVAHVYNVQLHNHERSIEDIYRRLAATELVANAAPGKNAVAQMKSLRAQDKDQSKSIQALQIELNRLKSETKNLKPDLDIASYVITRDAEALRKQVEELHELTHGAEGQKISESATQAVDEVWNEIDNLYASVEECASISTCQEHGDSMSGRIAYLEDLRKQDKEQILRLRDRVSGLE